MDSGLEAQSLLSFRTGILALETANTNTVVPHGIPQLPVVHYFPISGPADTTVMFHMHLLIFIIQTSTRLL